MPALTIRQTFEKGAAPASKMDAVAREVLAELTDPASEGSAAAAAAGLEPADLTDARVEITEANQGLDGFFTPIIVAIAVSAGSKVAETLWTEVIWPRIRRRLGMDALGDATAPPEEL